MCVGGSDGTEWEDITGSTQMSVVNGCVSFTSAVSARSGSVCVACLTAYIHWALGDFNVKVCSLMKLWPET